MMFVRTYEALLRTSEAILKEHMMNSKLSKSTTSRMGGKRDGSEYTAIENMAYHVIMIPFPFKY